MTDPDESKAKMTWNLVRFGKQDAEKGILVFQIYSIHIIDRIPDARKKWDLRFETFGSDSIYPTFIRTCILFFFNFGHFGRFLDSSVFSDIKSVIEFVISMMMKSRPTKKNRKIEKNRR